MTAMTVRTFITRADHHQIYLGSPTESEAKIFDGDIGPLVVQPDPADPVALIIRTGCSTGPVRVSVEMLGMGHEPEPLTQVVPGYEVTEEVPLQIMGSGLALIEEIGWGRRQEVLAPLETNGAHRVRVSATGRGLHYDGAVEEPEEDYLIQIYKVYSADGPAGRVTVGEDEASRLG